MIAGGDWIIEIYSDDPFSIPGGKWVPVCEDLDEEYEDLIIPLRFKTYMAAESLMQFYFKDRVDEQEEGGIPTVRVAYSPRDTRLLN